MPLFVVLLQDTSYRRKIDVEMCEQSGLMNDLIGDLDYESLEGEIELPLDVNNPGILDIALDFMNRHINNPVIQYSTPIKNNDLESLIGKEDCEFLSSRVPDIDDLINLLLVANYINCQGLLNICIAKFATMIRNASSQDIRNMFGITEELTVEEERQIRMDNMWLFDLTYNNELAKISRGNNNLHEQQ